MPQLKQLRSDHASALLEFETRNRAFFAASIPDRGDDYFAEFAARHAALVAEQDTGTIHMHLVIDDNGAVTGRINLVDVADGAAEVGYRIAQAAAGQGLATWALREVCQLAAGRYELKRLTARTTTDNHASHVVLTRTGFTVTGDVVLDGKPGLSYRRELNSNDLDATKFKNSFLGALSPRGHRQKLQNRRPGSNALPGFHLR